MSPVVRVGLQTGTLDVITLLKLIKHLLAINSSELKHCSRSVAPLKQRTGWLDAARHYGARSKLSINKDLHAERKQIQACLT